MHYDKASITLNTPVTLVLITSIEVPPGYTYFQLYVKGSRLYISENCIYNSGGGSFVRNVEDKP